MIVVDTSVWIDVLRDRDTPQVERFDQLLRDGMVLAVTGVVRMELLRGVSSRMHRKLRSSLDELAMVETLAEDFDAAADLYRASHDAGTGVRSSVDCLIAAPCIRAGVPLLHSDRDFDRIAAVSDLRIVH